MVAEAPGTSQLRTIPQQLEYAAGTWPDKSAIEDGEVTLTFSQLKEAALRGARGLVAAGVQHGDRVGIYGFSLDMEATHVNGVYHDGPLGTGYVEIDKLYATAPPISGEIDYSKKYEPVDFHDEPLAPNWI